MATQIATPMPDQAIRSAQAQLVGTAQAIVDLYEQHPDLAFQRLAKAVADYETVVLEGRA